MVLRTRDVCPQGSGRIDQLKERLYPNMKTRYLYALCVGLLALTLSLPLAQAATLPASFVEQGIGGTWNEAAGLTFASDGRMYVWERGGRVPKRTCVHR